MRRSRTAEAKCARAPRSEAAAPRYWVIALIAAARRLLLRAAAFLCTTFLSAIESITLVALLSVSIAIFLSPAAIALRTVLIAVRRRECCAVFWALRAVD